MRSGIVSVPDPPWCERATVEQEFTPEGFPIICTKFGPHYRGQDGQLYPYVSPQELADRLYRRRPEGPCQVRWIGPVWDW